MANVNVIDYALPAANGAVGIANSLMNYQSQRENRQVQIDLMREQNKFQEHMYERQLHDNSPLSQVQKLSAAGLNPALNFSDAQGISSPSVNSAPQVDAPQNNFSDVALSTAQAIGLLSQSNYNNEQAKGQNIDNQYRDAYNLVMLDELDSRRGLNDVQRAYVRAMESITSRSAQSQVEGFALQNQEMRLRQQVISAEAQKFAADKAVSDSIAALNWKENDYKVPMLQAAIKSTLAKAAADFSQASLNKAQVPYYGKLTWQTYENTLKIQAERQGIKLSNSQMKILWPSVQQQVALTIDAMRYENNMSRNELMYQLPNLREDLISKKNQIRQQGSDYWNPFRYTGMFMGGAAAGATGQYMRNAQVGSKARVVVKGFVP